MEDRWKSRITRYTRDDPRSLVANPLNFRAHPQSQADAMDGILDQVGWVAPTIVNDTTGHVLDGHLRVERAIAHNEAEIDVAHIEVTEEEEHVILATFDPLGALAETNKPILAALLERVKSPSGPVQQMLRDLAEREGIHVGPPSLDELEEKHPEPPGSTFWPEIKLKVPMDTFKMWQTMMEGVPGDKEHLRFADILIAADGVLP